MKNNHKIAKVYKKISIKEQVNDFIFWQARSYEERLSTVEQIRQEYHGWKDDTEQRLQRVYRIIKQ